MKLDTRQMDRAVGAVIGAAAGDALGVHYEPKHEFLNKNFPAEMLGGGFGSIAPGQWSDDTEMANCITEVAALGLDLRSDEAFELIAHGFLRWYAMRPPDIGNQTAAVLRQVSSGEGAGARMLAASKEYAARHPKSAGNGSLMRTSPVALAHLGDSDAIAEAARKISDLTHYDLVAGDGCVLWSLAIDHAIRTGEIDVRVGLPYVDACWGPMLDEALTKEPPFYASGDGWVVNALLGAVTALTTTDNLEDALQAAVHGSHDTDTVAAIAGGLAGAAYGGSTVPARWRRMIFGWPNDYRVRDLTRLAVLAARGGKPDSEGWPTAATIPSYAGASSVVVEHPDDSGVLLGAVGGLRAGVADAVVSLCRLGSEQAPVTKDPADHVEVWLIDQDDANNDLPRVLRDTASVIRDLRSEGKTVFLHCVHAETRTPVVAAAHGALITGDSPEAAFDRVAKALPTTRPRPSIKAGLILP